MKCLFCFSLKHEQQTKRSLYRQWYNNKTHTHTHTVRARHVSTCFKSSRSVRRLPRGDESFPTRPYKERSGQVWGKAQEVKGASFRKQEASLNPSTVCVVPSQQNNQLMVFLLRHASVFDVLSRRIGAAFYLPMRWRFGLRQLERSFPHQRLFSFLLK